MPQHTLIPPALLCAFLFVLSGCASVRAPQAHYLISTLSFRACLALRSQ